MDILPGHLSQQISSEQNIITQDWKEMKQNLESCFGWNQPIYNSKLQQQNFDQLIGENTRQISVLTMTIFTLRTKLNINNKKIRKWIMETLMARITINLITVSKK